MPRPSWPLLILGRAAESTVPRRRSWATPNPVRIGSPGAPAHPHRGRSRGMFSAPLERIRRTERPCGTAIEHRPCGSGASMRSSAEAEAVAGASRPSCRSRPIAPVPYAPLFRSGVKPAYRSMKLCSTPGRVHTSERGAAARRSRRRPPICGRLRRVGQSAVAKARSARFNAGSRFAENAFEKTERRPRIPCLRLAHRARSGTETPSTDRT